MSERRWGGDPERRRGGDPGQPGSGGRGRPWSDEETLAELAVAIRAAEEVPREVVASAQAAFTWRSIDDELARLAYDSETDGERTAALTRSESAPLRALTFACHSLTIELEVAGDALVGQIVPGQVTDINVRVLSGVTATVRSDEVGGFTIRPIPDHPFHLQCRTGDGVRVSTSWITL
ncbi:hypothetical protein [Nonomuraea sp. NPDC050691]|uniref:hypothetical protein n=1 Tax=Nonomuraea sp. NPDC050691 TaxID=3155661 RepID=UPI0033CC4000